MTTTQIRRPEDLELLGQVRELADGQCVALTIFGVELTGPSTRAEAEATVRAEGLSALAGHWWLQHGDRWYDCTLQEVTPSQVRVWVNAYDFPESSPAVRLAMPVDGFLRRRTSAPRR